MHETPPPMPPNLHADQTINPPTAPAVPNKESLLDNYLKAAFPRKCKSVKRLSGEWKKKEDCKTMNDRYVTQNMFILTTILKVMSGCDPYFASDMLSKLFKNKLDINLEIRRKKRCEFTYCSIYKRFL